MGKNQFLYMVGEHGDLRWCSIEFALVIELESSFIHCDLRGCL